MAANRTNDTTFLGARYRRLARRIGKLKALVALPAGKATASKVQARNGSWSAITPERAEGDATVRSNLIAHLRHLIDGSDAWTARKRDELVGSLKTKLGLRRSKAGLLRIEHGAAKREEHLDGTWLLRTSDVTLTPQNLAAAYKQLLAVERGWRDMKGALGCAPCSTTAKTVSAATLVKVWSGHQFEKVQELGVGEWRRASQSSLSGTPARLHLEHHHQRPRCGGDYFTRRNPDKAKSPIIDQLRTIEYDVTLTPRRLSSPQQQ